MKRLVLALLTIFALTAAGAVVAQSANTTAPGPTQQREPSQTNNNLPNPGNPQTNLQRPTTTTGVAPETEQGEGMDLDVDTGARAEDGLVDVEVNQTHDADTSAQGNDQAGTTGTMTGANDRVDNQAQGSTTGLTNVPDRDVDVDVDTGDQAAGAVDVDVDRTTDADTSASGVDETGAAYGDQDTLPATASGLPLMALIGLLCLGAACTVRTLAKRDI